MLSYLKKFLLPISEQVSQCVDLEVCLVYPKTNSVQKDIDSAYNTILKNVDTTNSSNSDLFDINASELKDIVDPKVMNDLLEDLKKIKTPMYIFDNILFQDTHGTNLLAIKLNNSCNRTALVNTGCYSRLKHYV